MFFKNIDLFHICCFIYILVSIGKKLTFIFKMVVFYLTGTYCKIESLASKYKNITLLSTSDYPIQKKIKLKPSSFSSRNV